MEQGQNGRAFICTYTFTLEYFERAHMGYVFLTSYQSTSVFNLRLLMAVLFGLFQLCFSSAFGVACGTYSTQLFDL